MAPLVFLLVAPEPGVRVMAAVGAIKSGLLPTSLLHHRVPVVAGLGRVLARARGRQVVWLLDVHLLGTTTLETVYGLALVHVLLLLGSTLVEALLVADPVVRIGGHEVVVGWSDMFPTRQISKMCARPCSPS